MFLHEFLSILRAVEDRGRRLFECRDLGNLDDFRAGGLSRELQPITESFLVNDPRGAVSFLLGEFAVPEKETTKAFSIAGKKPDVVDNHRFQIIRRRRRDRTGPRLRRRRGLLCRGRRKLLPGLTH